MNVLLLERGSGDWIRNGCTKYSIVAQWVVNPWMIFFVPAGLCKLFTLNLTTMLLQNAALYFYHRQGRSYLWQFLGPLQPREFWIELFICQSSPWARLRLCLNLFWRLSCSVNQVSHRSKAYFSPSCCNALMCILWLYLLLLNFWSCSNVASEN